MSSNQISVFQWVRVLKLWLSQVFLQTSSFYFLASPSFPIQCLGALTSLTLCFSFFKWNRKAPGDWEGRNAFPPGGGVRGIRLWLRLSLRECLCYGEASGVFHNDSSPPQSLQGIFLRSSLWRSSTFAWKIPWTEEPVRLQSLGLQRVGHDWVTSLSLSSSLMVNKSLKYTNVPFFSSLTHNSHNPFTEIVFCKVTMT